MEKFAVINKKLEETLKNKFKKDEGKLKLSRAMLSNVKLLDKVYSFFISDEWAVSSIG